MANASNEFTLDWFGTTTFRLRAGGLTIFLDTWLDRLSAQPKFLSIDDVEEADYIFISHAHFDHLPGADRLAKRTGAIVIANCEAITILRNTNVPDSQLMAVQGGERVPLFTKETLKLAAEGKISLRPAPPTAPPLPHPSHAVMSVDIWPSLHCLMPAHEKVPMVMDTATVWEGPAHPYVCTFDINYGMKHGLLHLDKLIPQDKRSPGIESFLDYVKDRKTNLFSDHDGGQLMYNIHLSEGKTVLWNAHLGAYEGIMRFMEPKPKVAILGIAGRANYNGKPFEGSAAQFAVQEVGWLNEPGQIIWCLHDESPIPPLRIDTKAATDAVEKSTASKIVDLKAGASVKLKL